MSMLLSKGTDRTAGSRLRTYGGAEEEVVGEDEVEGCCCCCCCCCCWCRWALMRCMKVVLPEPAMPMQMIATGGWGVVVVEEAAMVGVSRPEPECLGGLVHTWVRGDRGLLSSGHSLAVPSFGGRC